MSLIAPVPFRLPPPRLVIDNRAAGQHRVNRPRDRRAVHAKDEGHFLLYYCCLPQLREEFRFLDTRHSFIQVRLIQRPRSDGGAFLRNDLPDRRPIGQRKIPKLEQPMDHRASQLWVERLPIRDALFRLVMGVDKFQQLRNRDALLGNRRSIEFGRAVE